MATKNAGGGKITSTPISRERADQLIGELARRLNVVTAEALDHLVYRKVIQSRVADGCCKPDGGTCCPNARLTVFDARVTRTRE
jgi:hypothetical protein